MSIDAAAETDETPYAFCVTPELEEESKVEDAESIESMAHEIINAKDGVYSSEETIPAKAALIPSDYKHLANLCEQGGNHPDSISIEALLSETQRQKKEATLCKDEAAIMVDSLNQKDYNLGKEIIDLFLGKEESLDGILRDKGKKLTNLNQIIKELNDLKKHLLKKERLEKELNETSRSERSKIQEQIETLDVKIAECKQKISGKKIQSLQSFFGICQETKIELPDESDTKELKEIVSDYMSKAQSEVKQGFHNLQEIYLHKTGCFEVTKNILDNLQKVLREIIKNQRVNG